MLQNTQTVTVHILFWQILLPQILLIFLILLISLPTIVLPILIAAGLTAVCEEAIDTVDSGWDKLRDRHILLKILYFLLVLPVYVICYPLSVFGNGLYY